MQRVVALLACAAPLLFPAGARAELRAHTPDADRVARAEAIAVGYLVPETVEYVPHVWEDRTRSWEHHALLVVEHWVKGAREEVEVPMVLQYGVDVRIAGAWREELAGVGPEERAGVAIDVLNVSGDVIPMEPLDASQSLIWFLRTVGEEPYGRQAGTGRLGILEPDDLQPSELLSYFQAYLAPDPEAAVAEEVRRDPTLAERAREYLEHREVERILALPDPEERVAALLPFYGREGPASVIQEAREGIVAAGEAAGPLLLPLFESPERYWLRGDVIRLWGDVGYGEAVPLLVRIVEEDEAYHARLGRSPAFARDEDEAYGMLLTALYTLRRLGDPAAREAVEGALERWSALPQGEQIAQECARYLETVRAP